jgi:hypothetical protein
MRPALQPKGLDASRLHLESQKPGKIHHTVMCSATRFAKLPCMRDQTAMKRLIVTTSLAMAAFVVTIGVSMRHELSHSASPSLPAISTLPRTTAAAGGSPLRLPHGNRLAQPEVQPEPADTSAPVLAPLVPGAADRPPSAAADQSPSPDASLRSDRAALHSARSR